MYTLRHSGERMFKLKYFVKFVLIGTMTVTFLCGGWSIGLIAYSIISGDLREPPTYLLPTISCLGLALFVLFCLWEKLSDTEQAQGLDCQSETL